MKAYRDALLIASRATHAENNTYGAFYKSYVKHARVIRAEQTTPYFTEHDFEFEYKGCTYRLYEKVTGEHSAIGTYRIEKVN